MADLDFSVAMTGVQQAEKGLDTLAKKSDQVAKSEKMREKATEAANKAQSKAAIPIFGSAGASSKYDPFKAARYQTQQAEKVARETVLQQKAAEVAQAAKIKAAEKEKIAQAKAEEMAVKQNAGGRIARVFGKIGGAVGQASGLGEIGALGAGFGVLAAGAVAVGATLKIFSASLQMANKLTLERVAGIVKESAMERQARDMQGQSGVRALESQGANLLRLESLGPAFTDMAKKMAVAGKGGTSFDVTDTQTAVLAASKGGAGFTETRNVVEAARRLATLSGSTLTEAVKSLRDSGVGVVSVEQAIATALSTIEDRRVSVGDVKTREMYLRESETAATIQEGRKLKAQAGLAEQGNLGLSIDTLTRQLIDIQAPLINLQADAFRENSTKVDALKAALDAQSPLVTAIDRLWNGVNSLSGQFAQSQRELTGGRTDSMGSIPLTGN